MSKWSEVFSFRGGEVRSRLVNGETYFCLADVCKIIGTSASQASKKTKGRNGSIQIEVVCEDGIHPLVFISKVNLCRIVLQAQSNGAYKLSEWLINEFLPTVHEKTLLQRLDLIDSRLNEVERTLNKLATSVQKTHSKSHSTTLAASPANGCEGTEVTVNAPASNLQPCSLTNLVTGEKKYYHSLRAACRFLGVNPVHRATAEGQVFGNWQFHLED